jgi:hypothetical protein
MAFVVLSDSNISVQSLRIRAEHCLGELHPTFLPADKPSRENKGDICFLPVSFMHEEEKISTVVAFLLCHRDDGSTTVSITNSWMFGKDLNVDQNHTLKKKTIPLVKLLVTKMFPEFDVSFSEEEMTKNNVPFVCAQFSKKDNPAAAPAKKHGRSRKVKEPAFA